MESHRDTATSSGKGKESIDMCKKWFVFICAVILQLLSCYPHVLLARIYYVSPKPNTPCPTKDNAPCMTLSQYANEPDSYFASNTTLILLPGNHTLTENFNMSEKVYFAVTSVPENHPTTVTITCGNNGKFYFSDTEHVYLGHLKTIRCEHVFSSLERLTIKDCSVLDDRGTSSTEIVVREVNEAEIDNSQFSCSTSGTETNSNGHASKAGGTFLILGSYVSITNSHFDGNLVATLANTTKNTMGGVAQLSNSTLKIQSSTFKNNVAYFGGVFYSVNSDVTIIDSHLSDNGDNFREKDFKPYAYGGGVLYSVYSNVSIRNCWISNNTARHGGAVAVVYTTLDITNSTFLHNEAFHGSGGAIYIGNTTKAVISNCTFANNTALEGSALYNHESIVIVQNSNMLYNVANMIGAAIHCLRGMAQNDTAVIDLINVTVSHNSATIPQGLAIIYLHLCTFTSSGFLNIEHSTANTSVIYILQSNATFQGITNISNNNGSIVAIDSHISIEGTALLLHNTPYKRDESDKRNQEGGALTLFRTTVFLSGNVTLMHNKADNGGAILVIESSVDVSGTLTIANNSATFSGGGVYSYHSEINLNGNGILKDNIATENGGGMQTIGSTTRFSNGSFRFLGNKAKKGGGMFLDLNAKVYIIKNEREKHNCSEEHIHGEPCVDNKTQWLTLEFANNFAELGGALYVNDDTNTGSCSTTETSAQYLPAGECFFQTLSMYWNLNTIKRLHFRNTIFTNNYATTAGSSLYGGLIDRCTKSPFTERFDGDSSNPVDYFQQITNITADSISSQPVRVCFCVNGKPNCSYNLPTQYAKKGQEFVITAVAVDQIDHPLPAVIRCSLYSNGGYVSKTESRQKIPGKCTKLKYEIFAEEDAVKLYLYAEGPCKDEGISQCIIDLQFLPCDYCPIGFKTPASSCTCQCDPALYPYITNCSIATGLLQRSGEFWIDYVNFTNDSGFLIYPHCPFDYCYPPTHPVLINFSQPSGADSQCSFHRSGVLCGKCKPGYSLTFGNSHCKTCSSNWIALLLIFALAGMVLVAFVLILNLTVAVGTINGLVLYANIIAANKSIFFPFDKANVLTVFISWINLDFGFETCFYNGMDAYVNTWLQFAFPLYVMFLVVTVIGLCHYSQRFAKLLTGKNPVATLATLILLSYTKMFRTILAVLSFVQLKYPNGSHETVWLLDGNVSYLHGKHIPLFVASIIVALLCLACTLLLFLWQWITRASEKVFLFKWTTNTRLQSFIDAFHAPFTHKHRYWLGMLLLTRVLLYLISAINVLGDPRVNLAFIASAMILLQVLLSYRPYKNMILNTLEHVFILNLAIFAVATSYFIEKQGIKAALAYTSATISFVLFTAIIVYHTFKFTLQCLPVAERFQQLQNRLFDTQQRDEFEDNEARELFIEIDREDSYGTISNDTY